MRRILLKVAIVVVLLISAGAFFYTLFLSPNSANHDHIMTMRYAYAPLLQRLHLPEPVIRVARRDTADPDFYWYTLRGQVEQVDPDHLVMHASDGRLYHFNMYWRLTDANTVQHIGLDARDLRDERMQPPRRRLPQRLSPRHRPWVRRDSNFLLLGDCFVPIRAFGMISQKERTLLAMTQ